MEEGELMILTASIDPARLRRAFRLDTIPLPSGGWTVGSWHVDPVHGCNCPDRTIRGVSCKHELAARLDRLDPEMRDALRDLEEEA